MTNSATPFGYREQGLIDGISPNAGVTTGVMASGTGPVGYGDVLAIANGVLTPAAEVNGGAQIAGIAVSFSWISVAQGRRVWQAFYPGNDAAAGTTVTVKLLTNPFTILEVMPLNLSAAGAVTQASVGKYANFSAGAGGTSTGGGAWFSSYALDDSTISAVQGNLPFKIISIEQQPKTDPTSANNLVRVQMVNLSGGV